MTIKQAMEKIRAALAASLIEDKCVSVKVDYWTYDGGRNRTEFSVWVAGLSRHFYATTLERATLHAVQGIELGPVTDTQDPDNAAGKIIAEAEKNEKEKETK